MRRLALALLLAAALPPLAAARPPSGEGLFNANCLRCHGDAGRGTDLAPSLRGVGARAADLYLRTGYMPLPSPSEPPARRRVLLSEPELDALIAYVASLGHGPPVPTPHPERGSVSRGLQLFTEHCAGCHQVAIAGGYVTGARVPPLDQATPTQIAEAVRVGPYLMPRFSRQQLSDRQLDSIIRYVEYAKSPDDRGGWALGHVGPVPEGLVTWFLAMVVLVGTCVAFGRRRQA